MQNYTQNSKFWWYCISQGDFLRINKNIDCLFFFFENKNKFLIESRLRTENQNRQKILVIEMAFDKQFITQENATFHVENFPRPIFNAI